MLHFPDTCPHYLLQETREKRGGGKMGNAHLQGNRPVSEASMFFQ